MRGWQFSFLGQFLGSRNDLRDVCWMFPSVTNLRFKPARVQGPYMGFHFRLPLFTRRYQIIEVARTNAETLKQPEVIRSIANILQTNTSVCGAVGQPFQSQISLIFEDMLHMYKLYSEFVSSAVMEGGKFSARTTQVIESLALNWPLCSVHILRGDQNFRTAGPLADPKQVRTAVRLGLRILFCLDPHIQTVGPRYIYTGDVLGDVWG